MLFVGVMMPPGSTVMFVPLPPVKVVPVAVRVPATTICAAVESGIAAAQSHRVAAGEAERPVVGERRIRRDLDGNVGPHAQRCTRRHGEGAGEDVSQVRRVGADQVEVELMPLGRVPALDLDLVEALIVAGCQGRHIGVGHEEGQIEGAASGGDDAAGADGDVRRRCRR